VTYTDLNKIIYAIIISKDSVKKIPRKEKLCDLEDILESLF